MAPGATHGLRVMLFTLHQTPNLVRAYFTPRPTCKLRLYPAVLGGRLEGRGRAMPCPARHAVGAVERKAAVDLAVACATETGVLKQHTRIWGQFEPALVV